MVSFPMRSRSTPAERIQRDSGRVLNYRMERKEGFEMSKPRLAGTSMDDHEVTVV